MSEKSSGAAAAFFALGRLASDRFGRYIVTILFDMFFTVILFKHGYTRLVQIAGFSESGREWIANGFVSAFILSSCTWISFTFWSPDWRSLSRSSTLYRSSISRPPWRLPR